MPCNTCEQTVNTCNCTTTSVSNCVTPDCSCAVRIGTDCWTYTGEDLPCSLIKTGTIGTELIQQLDTFICTKFDEVQHFLAILNMGDGVGVYKGIDLFGRKELRTIKSLDTTLLDIVENTDTIDITPGTPSITLDSDTDILSLIVTTLGGANTFSTIDLSEYNYDTFVQSASFDSGTLDLTIVRNNGEPNIVVPLDFLNKYVTTASYGAGTNTVTLTLVGGATVSLNLATLVSEILAAATHTTLAGYTISDTKANFNTALSDGDFVFVGDINKAYIDALNVDADTLDGIDSTAFAQLAGAAFVGDITVPDEAYDATAWNGNLEAPTKNAIRDKIESLGTVQKTKVTLSAAQIKTLNSVPITLVAAQGVGTIIQVLSVVCKFNWGSVAFDASQLNFNSLSGDDEFYINSNFISSTVSERRVAASTNSGDVSIPENALFRAYSNADSVATGDSTIDVYVTYTVTTL